MSLDPRPMQTGWRRVRQHPGLTAALPAAIAAVGFGALFVAHLLGGGPPDLPGREALYAWWFVELGAFWALPVAAGLQRLSGTAGLRRLVVYVLPGALLVTLVCGTLAGSATLAASGFALFFVHVKCVSYYCASVGDGGRDSFLCRAMVGGFSWVLSVVLAALAMVVVRHTFRPVAFAGPGMLHCVLLTSGGLYFAVLSALEWFMPRYAAPASTPPTHEPTSASSDVPAEPRQRDLVASA